MDGKEQYTHDCAESLHLFFTVGPVGRNKPVRATARIGVSGKYPEAMLNSKLVVRSESSRLGL